MEKPRILFLCQGNNCLSQIAEAWARHLAPDFLSVKSAGLEACGINEEVITIMKEVDIDMSDYQSTRINVEVLQWADLIVTLSDSAEEQCPIIDTDAVKLHIPLVDPARYKRRSKSGLDEYREVRDSLKDHVAYLIEQLQDYHQVGHYYFSRR